MGNAGANQSDLREREYIEKTLENYELSQTQTLSGVIGDHQLYISKSDDTKGIVKKSVEIGSNNEVMDMKNLIATRMELSSPFLARLLGTTQDKPESWCASFYRVSLYYEVSLYSLLTEVNSKRSSEHVQVAKVSFIE